MDLEKSRLVVALDCTVSNKKEGDQFKELRTTDLDSVLCMVARQADFI